MAEHISGQEPSEGEAGYLRESNPRPGPPGKMDWYKGERSRNGALAGQVL